MLSLLQDASKMRKQPTSQPKRLRFIFVLMRFKSLILSTTLTTATLFASPTERQYVGSVGLQLNGTKYLTDKSGVFQPQQFIRAAVNDNVKIYRPDGACYIGKITEVLDSPEMYKVYGEVSNQEDCLFGFVATKEGTIVGVIREKRNRKTYVLEFSQQHKGYIFIQTFKFDGPEARLR